jgi:TusA-related sulfurtransferase
MRIDARGMRCPWPVLRLARAMREKFGGDSLKEMKRNFDGYRAQIKEY